jgi:Putative zinc-finger
MIEAPTPCEAQIELETLSAWRDRAMDTTEYQQLEKHIRSCPACQYRLQVFEGIGRILRTQRNDSYQEQIWHGLQTKMQRPMARHLRLSSSFVVNISVIVIIVLIALLAFQGHLRQGHPVATATPLTTVTPAMPPNTQLNWQPIPLGPWHVAGDANTIGFTPAPHAGEQAYVCTQPQGTTTVHIWKTNDRGAHWQSLGNLASVSNGSCNMVVDQQYPDTVILNITQNASTSPTHMMSYISYDSGQSWQSFLPGEFVSNLWLNVTGPSVTTGYAVLTDTYSNTGPYLAVSHDSFKAWQKIMPPNTTLLFDYWHSSSQALLLRTNRGLWLTDDQGQSWHNIAPSVQPGSTQAYQKGGGSDWNICYAIGPGTIHFYCSQNTGQTWQQYLIPNGDSGVNMVSLDGVASDGTFIVRTFSNLPKPNQQLYRFSLQSGQWQSMGVTPDSIVTFARTDNGGNILWAWYTGNPIDDTQQRSFSALLP